MTIQLLVTDRNLNIVGDPIDAWTQLEATRRFNEPATGQVSLIAWPEVMAQLQPGNRLTVIRDGAVWMSGPMEIPQAYSWGIDSEQEPGIVTVSFSDDLAVIAGYITWVTPASAWSGQHDTNSRVITSTNAESIIRTLVSENCGPTALAARKIPALVLGSVATVGTSTSVTTRFEALLDACRRVAASGGQIGFRTTVSGTQIVFSCYAPADKTGTARFSRGLGNLRSVQFTQSAPTITSALVQGSEVPAPASRAFVEVADATAASSWWRVEQLVDGGADSDTSGELTAAGTAQLTSGSAPVELATVTVDTEDLQAGRDFDLGDKVTIELPTGLEVVDVVRAITLQATPESGEDVTTLVGSPEATSDPAMVRLVRELGRRLGRLEAR